MEIVYEWRVLGLKTKTEGNNSNSVVRVRWVKTGYNTEGNEYGYEGSTVFSSVNTENFINLEDLTEAQVLTWVQAAIADTDQEDFADDYIQRELAAMSNPYTLLSHEELPWH